MYNTMYMGAYYFKGFQVIHGYVVGPKYSEYCKDMSLGKRTILCVASMTTNRIHLTILHTNTSTVALWHRNDMHNIIYNKSCHGAHVFLK